MLPTCDRCGKHTDEIFTPRDSLTQDPNHPAPWKTGLDLCRECYEGSYKERDEAEAQRACEKLVAEGKMEARTREDGQVIYKLKEKKV